MATLTIRIDDKLKAQVESACKGQDLTVSQVIRSALRDFVSKSKSADKQEQLSFPPAALSVPPAQVLTPAQRLQAAAMAKRRK